MDALGAVVLVAALDRVWSAIRQHHPDVPGVMLLPAPNPHSNANVLGHFAALRWSARPAGDAHVVHEVIVVAEHLNRSAEDVVETLLHEAAHAMNFARGKKDCSRSQYHNRLFEAAATELGLSVHRVPHYGFALTKLLPETAERYASETAELAAVLIHRRAFTALPATPPKTPTSDGDDRGDDDGADDNDNSKGRLKKATCKCPFIIRASRKVLAATTISCGRCGWSFDLA